MSLSRPSRQKATLSATSSDGAALASMAGGRERSGSGRGAAEGGECATAEEQEAAELELPRSAILREHGESKGLGEYLSLRRDQTETDSPGMTRARHVEARVTLRFTSCDRLASCAYVDVDVHVVASDGFASV